MVSQEVLHVVKTTQSNDIRKSPFPDLAPCLRASSTTSQAPFFYPHDLLAERLMKDRETPIAEVYEAVDAPGLCSTATSNPTALSENS